MRANLYPTLSLRQINMHYYSLKAINIIPDRKIEYVAHISACEKWGFCVVQCRVYPRQVPVPQYEITQGRLQKDRISWKLCPWSGAPAELHALPLDGNRKEAGKSGRDQAEARTDTKKKRTSVQKWVHGLHFSNPFLRPLLSRPFFPGLVASFPPRPACRLPLL
jgi:hypothetical protein